MDLTEIYHSLCSYDRRNPLFNDIMDEDFPTEPRNDCYCDNCFYGRDALALEIIRLRGDSTMEKNLLPQHPSPEQRLAYYALIKARCSFLHEKTTGATDPSESRAAEYVTLSKRCDTYKVELAKAGLAHSIRFTGEDSDPEVSHYNIEEAVLLMFPGKVIGDSESGMFSIFTTPEHADEVQTFLEETAETLDLHRIDGAAEGEHFNVVIPGISNWPEAIKYLEGLPMNQRIWGEICTCGHRQDQHNDTFAFGHGDCKECDCQKFTWNGFLDYKDEPLS